MRKNKDLIISIICLAIIFAAISISFLLVDFTVLEDRLRALSYNPTPEISNLHAQLDLTERGNLIFDASYPVLETGETFNQHCDSQNSEISILGCYSAGQIYIFNITNTELPGIRESTLAHELLHAAWDRLPIGTRNALTPTLDKIYDDNYETLFERLKLYPEDQFHEELHSAIGTEYANLPDDLETHYARYFKDQDHIVHFFDSYNEKFQALKAEAEALYSTITTNQALIDAKTTNYNDALTELNAAIDDFNRRADNGYFTSQAAFQAERNALLARQRQLQALNDEIDALIDTTNAEIDRYNNNLSITQDLLDSINSNAAPPSEIETQSF